MKTYIVPAAVTMGGLIGTQFTKNEYVKLGLVGAAGAGLVKQFMNDDPTTYLSNENQQKNMLIDKVNESVPKEVLRSEKLINRLNWYYKDLKGWERITAHIILLVALSGIGLGLYYILNLVINNEELFNTIAPIVLSLLGISGITFQASSLKSPNKK